MCRGRAKSSHPERGLAETQTNMPLQLTITIAAHGVLRPPCLLRMLVDECNVRRSEPRRQGPPAPHRAHLWPEFRYRHSRGGARWRPATPARACLAVSHGGAGPRGIAGVDCGRDEAPGVRRDLPADPAGDALHLAIASYHRCDFLVTWNCKHLANANKFGHIRRVNGLLDLFTPALVTPLELLGDNDDEE